MSYEFRTVNKDITRLQLYAENLPSTIKKQKNARKMEIY